MDANKLKVLQDLSYEIRPACGLCVHGVFPQNDWGTCQKHQYDHLKHTGEPRQLSIFRYGSCKEYEFHKPLEPLIGTFNQFVS